MSDLLLVEKVAKAIYDATHAGLSNCYAWDDAWEDHQEARRGRYYKEARAAIATMEAHRPPVTVASLYGYEAGLVEGARAQWKPIKTAPKDGTVIDVWCQAAGGFRIPEVIWENRYAAFFSAEAGILANDLSHWMPLPSPPSIADDGKEGAG